MIRFWFEPARPRSRSASKVAQPIGSMVEELRALEQEMERKAESMRSMGFAEHRGEIQTLESCSRRLETIIQLAEGNTHEAKADAASALQKPTRRQIVFNWLMGEDDLRQAGGWWGTAEEVAEIDRLLLMLDCVNRTA